MEKSYSPAWVGSDTGPSPTGPQAEGSRGTFRPRASAVPRFLDVGLQSSGAVRGGVAAEDTLTGAAGEPQPFSLRQLAQIAQRFIGLAGDEDLMPRQEEFVETGPPIADDSAAARRGLRTR